MVPELGYVILYVPDVRRAIDFYVDAFGLQQRFIAEQDDYGELQTGRTALGFVNETVIGREGEHRFQPGRPNADPAGAKIALVVDDVPAAFDRAVAAGATPYGDPVRKPWGQTVGYVRDLNGFVVELCNAFAHPNS